MAATRIGLTANNSKPNAQAVLTQLCGHLEARGLEIVLEEESAQLLGRSGVEALRDIRAVAEAVDFLIVLGGDGTILRVVGQTIGIEVPIMGVNIGTLGFLTCATEDAIAEVPDWILSQHYRISHRTVLEARVEGSDDEEACVYWALNEVSVNRENVSRLVHLETHLNGEYLNHYNADGLIVSTPTGSTAYSLSAGGPIIDPESGVLVITPICPHALSNRSMVVNDDSVIEILAVDARDQVLLAVDGRAGQSLSPGSRIVVKRAPAKIQLVFLPDQSFYATLRHKLHWHGRNVS